MQRFVISIYYTFIFAVLISCINICSMNEFKNYSQENKIIKILKNDCNHQIQNIPTSAANIWYLRKKNNEYYKDLVSGTITSSAAINQLKNNLTLLKNTNLALNNNEKEFVDKHNDNFEDLFNKLENNTQSIGNLATEYQNYLGQIGFNQLFFSHCKDNPFSACSGCSTLRWAEEFAFNSLAEIFSIKNKCIQTLERDWEKNNNGVTFKEYSIWLKDLEEKKDAREKSIEILKHNKQLAELTHKNQQQESVDLLQKTHAHKNKLIENSSFIKMIQKGTNLSELKKLVMPDLFKIKLLPLRPFGISKTLATLFSSIKNTFVKNGSCEEISDLINDQSVEVEKSLNNIAKYQILEMSTLKHKLKNDEREFLKKIVENNDKIIEEYNHRNNILDQISKVKSSLQEYELIKQQSENFDVQVTIFTMPQNFYPVKNKNNEEISEGECEICCEQNVNVGKICPIKCNYVVCMPCAKLLNTCPNCRAQDFSKI